MGLIITRFSCILYAAVYFTSNYYFDREVVNPEKPLLVELTDVYFKQAIVAILTRLFGDVCVIALNMLM